MKVWIPGQWKLSGSVIQTPIGILRQPFHRRNRGATSLGEKVHEEARE